MPTAPHSFMLLGLGTTGPRCGFENLGKNGRKGEISLGLGFADLPVSQI
jgi:hypothetical protein